LGLSHRRKHHEKKSSEHQKGKVSSPLRTKEVVTLVRMTDLVNRNRGGNIKRGKLKKQVRRAQRGKRGEGAQDDHRNAKFSEKENRSYGKEKNGRFRI